MPQPEPGRSASTRGDPGRVHAAEPSEPGPPAPPRHRQTRFPFHQDHDCDKAGLYSSTMRQRSALDSVVEIILVDAYGDDEQYVAFLTVIEEETRLPAAATLLGAPVTVTGFDYTNEARGLVAICEGSNGTGEVALADLAFPPDTVTAWIHAAYRHHLGLQPFPVRPRPDWTWPD